MSCLSDSEGALLALGGAAWRDAMTNPDSSCRTEILGRRGMPRRAALGVALGLPFMTGGSWTAASAQPQHAAHEADTAGIHNMLAFGDKTVFLSHFPMFQQMSEDGTRFATMHRFQLIMEVEFRTPQGQDATKLYRQARQQHPEVRMYSLKPETLVLQDLFAPPSGGQPRRSFAAGVFFDHLE